MERQKQNVKSIVEEVQTKLKENESGKNKDEKEKKKDKKARSSVKKRKSAWRKKFKKQKKMIKKLQRKAKGKSSGSSSSPSTSSSGGGTPASDSAKKSTKASLSRKMLRALRLTKSAKKQDELKLKLKKAEEELEKAMASPSTKTTDNTTLGKLANAVSSLQDQMEKMGNATASVRRQLTFQSVDNARPAKRKGRNDEDNDVMDPAVVRAYATSLGFPKALVPAKPATPEDLGSILGPQVNIAKLRWALAQRGLPAAGSIAEKVQRFLEFENAEDGLGNDAADDEEDMDEEDDEDDTTTTADKKAMKTTTAKTKVMAMKAMKKSRG